MKLFVVITIATPFEDEYIGDILLITDDEERAKALAVDYNLGKDIEGINRTHLADNDGKAAYFERTLNQTITTDDNEKGE
jgi:hypothetical protein